MSLTGVGLNHSIDFGFDRRFVSAPWLLSWYGIDAPPPAVSYVVDRRRVTLVGNRLYLDAREAARGIAEVTGAVSWNGLVVVATAESLLYVSPSAELVDRVDLQGELPGPIAGLTAGERSLIVRSADSLFGYDERGLEVVPLDEADSEYRWLSASSVPADILEEINRQYRGSGLTLERLLYDLHSGRIFTRAGIVLMDIVGALLVVLSITGLVLWFKRKS